MCLSPIEKKYMRHGVEQVAYIPCGKCFECVESFQQSWQLRLVEECKCWKYSYFLTLTYDDAKSNALTYIDVDCCDTLLDVAKHLDSHPTSVSFLRRRSQPLGAYLSANAIRDYYDLKIDVLKVPVVNKYHVVNWLKSSRENYYRHSGNRNFMKYFICSEYGPETFRPHYHALIMSNIPEIDFRRFFVEPWASRYGNVQCDVLPYYQEDFSNVAAYVSKYCSKPSFIQNPYEKYHLVPKCFRLISKGIGLRERDRLTSLLQDYKNFPFPWNSSPNACRGDYYGFDKKFIEWFNSQLFCYVHDKKKQTVFKVKMPRYWRDAAAYPRVEKLKTVFSNTESAKSLHVGVLMGSYSVRKIYCPDKETELSYALDNYILEANTELYLRQYRQIQADHPTWQNDEITSELLRCQASRDKERIKKSFQRLHDFYNKKHLNSITYGSSF
ncbi:replication initiator protein [Sigmofec virus UA08Rod_4577]|uniref:Replication initiator protein n=1 Tax=Sigmofec virus UA08Rod_4577 TaxID=2929404 RepID=A0A976N067_9VIRU|nr:replication initiator protein [Sigmofec virus UA08Rod_4577]